MNHFAKNSLFPRFWGLISFILIVLLPLISSAQITWKATDIKLSASLVVDQYPIYFYFKNSGNKPIAFLSIHPLCTCTTASIGKTTYLPGETGVLKAIFKVGQRTGVQDKFIDVKTDDSATPQRLTFHVIMPLLASLIPNHLMWKIGGSNTPQVMEFQVDQSDPVNILQATSSDSHFKIEIVPVERGFKYDIKISPCGATGPIKSIIAIRTDYPKVKPREFDGIAELNTTGS